MKKCSAKAFATCPDRAVCGSLNEAVCMEGSDCEKFNEAVDKQPLTNADRIRAMSDEELGALLCGFRLEGYGECSSCPLEWECDSGRKGNLIWLKDSNSEEWDCFMENYVKTYID